MSNPVTFRIPQAAYVPGQAGVGAMAREWTSVPRMVVLGTLLYALRVALTPASKRLAQQANVCQSKYCTQIHVDKPLNTLLKDQSMEVGLRRPRNLPGAEAVRVAVKREYYREQLASPGVQLVAAHVH